MLWNPVAGDSNDHDHTSGDREELAITPTGSQHHHHRSRRNIFSPDREISTSTAPDSGRRSFHKTARKVTDGTRNSLSTGDTDVDQVAMDFGINVPPSDDSDDDLH
jgi:hypothetical protein